MKPSGSKPLSDNERQFRMLVESAVDYALYMLDPNGIVANWNTGGQRIKGYTPAEIDGQHFSRFYTDADRASGKPARALQIARETAARSDPGCERWCSIPPTPIRSSRASSPPTAPRRSRSI